MNVFVKSILAILFFSISNIAMAAAPEALSIQEIAKQSGNNTFDYFGYSVAIDGDYMVVSTHELDSSQLDIVYLYQFNGNGFVEIAHLTASVIDGYCEEFGRSVAISGDTVVVGASVKDGCASSFPGSAYIFKKPDSGWGNMHETAKLTASDGANGDQFGWSVAIDGDTVVVGALYDDDGATSAGSAYIFTKPDLSPWVDANENAKLNASDPLISDGFGHSVAVDGNNILIGARGAGGTNYYGAAYLFKKPNNGDNPWVSTNVSEKLEASPRLSHEWFGSSVAIQGSTIAIGANGDVDYNLKGAMYIFEPNSGSGLFEQKAKLVASDGVVNTNNSFAHQSTIAINGDIIVVGNRDRYDNSSNKVGGAVYLFQKPDSGWINNIENNIISPSDMDVNDYFGCSVGFSGNKIIVGAYNECSEGEFYNGAAYVFTVGNSNENSAVKSIPAIINLLLN